MDLRCAYFNLSMREPGFRSSMLSTAVYPCGWYLRGCLLMRWVEIKETAFHVLWLRSPFEECAMVLPVELIEIAFSGRCMQGDYRVESRSLS